MRDRDDPFDLKLPDVGPARQSHTYDAPVPVPAPPVEAAAPATPISDIDRLKRGRAGPPKVLGVWRC